MPLQRVAILGATGMLGRPVANGLLSAGFDVTVMSRSLDSLAAFEGARRVRGDIFDSDSLRSAFDGRDVVYLNLRAGDTPDDPQPETEGLRNVIDASKAVGVRRIAMISSLVQNYQGMNGFHWWAFDRKWEAVEILKDSGLEWTIFYPTSFMENFLSSYRDGNKVLLVGDGKHPKWFIAGEDYAAQLARSFQLESAAGREYPVQGPEPLLTARAAEIFVENYTAEKLRISHVPLWPLRVAGLFSRKMRDLCAIIEALNEHPESFRADTTWQELGRPRLTIADFARQASKN